MLFPGVFLLALLVLTTSHPTAVTNALAMMNKRILVTGGNKGIGKAICQKLVSEWPDTIVYLGSRDSERGQAAIRDIVNAVGCAKDRLQLIVMDTSSDESVKSAASQLEGTTLYGIVNNAGVSWAGVWCIIFCWQQSSCLEC